MQCRRHYTPPDPLYGPLVSFPLILVSQPFRNVYDFRAYIARLRAFPDQVSDMIASMGLGAPIGLVSPRVLIERVIPQIRIHIVPDVTQSEFHAPVLEVSGLGETEATAVVAEIIEAIESCVIPAYLQLLAFVENEYLYRCRSTVGMGSVLNGRKLYETMAYLNTSVRLSPQEIHRLGLFEVDRIRGELAGVQKEIGFEGTLEEFLRRMDSDPGQLIFEMWRACRLVVDTGLHAEGWSRQEAIDYLAVNTGFTTLDVEAEVDRYISWPGQALSYRIGELRIMQLRREAKEQLKGRFDPRAFHDALLA